MGKSLNQLKQAQEIEKLKTNGGGGGSSDSAKRSDIATEFSATTSYTAGCYVYHDGKLYIFNVDHAAGAWDATDVAEANVTDEVTSNKAAIDALGDKVLPSFDDNNEGDCLIIKETEMDHYEPVWDQPYANNVKFRDPLHIFGATNVSEAINRLNDWRDTIIISEYAEYDDDTYYVHLSSPYPTFQLADFTDLNIEFAFSSVAGTSTRGLVVSGSDTIGCDNIVSLIDGKSDARICIRKAVNIGDTIKGYIDITLAFDTSNVDFEHDLTNVSLTGAWIEYDLTNNGTPVTGDITRETEIKIRITGKHSKKALITA